MMIRHVDWPDIEMPFDDPPSTALPTEEDLEALVAAGGAIHWCYHGLVRVLLPATIADALDTYRAYKQQRHRRVPVPPHVGKFLWAQTVSMGEAAIADALAKKPDQPPQAGPADEAASTGEPDH